MREKIYAVIEPKYNNKDSRAARIYDWVMLVAIALGITPLVFREQPRVFFYFDIFSCTVYIVDYLLRWLTADLRRAKRGNVWSFLAYPFTPLALIDLLSILPSLVVLNQSLKALRLFRLARALRVFRIFKVIRYSKNLQRLKNVWASSKSSLAVVGGLALGYIFVSALVVFNVEPDSFKNFFEAIYWATVSLTTVGYGDLYPVTTIGRVITMVSSIFGVAVIALPAGIITAGYMKEVENEKNNENSEMEKE